MENKEIKILTIDDNRDNLITLIALLKEVFPEVSVITALTGEKGLELAAAEDPDVILLDIVMPGMDGYEICRRLKADSRLSEIPVVFLTAIKGDKANRIQALECGAEAFLAKPLDESELIAQIRAMLKIRAANVQKRDEKERLAGLIKRKTHELENAYLRTLKLLEELQKENEARQKSERFLLEAQRLAQIGSFEFDVVRNRFTCTDEGLNICGIKGVENSVASDTIIQCIHPDDRAYVVKLSEQAVSEKRPVDYICRVIKKNGEERIVSVRLEPGLDENGKCIRTTGTIQDITERQQKENTIRENTLRFCSLFENMSSGAAIYRVINDGEYGKDYIIQDFNKASLLIEGKEKSEVVGKSLYDLRPNIDKYGLIPVFQEVWKTGKSMYFPSMVYIDQNFNNWYENRVFRLSSGEIVAIYDDVTEKNVMHEKLLESERKYRQITENISDVVWTADLNLKTTYISPSAERLLGELVQDHLSRTIEERFPPYFLNKIRMILYEELEKEKKPRNDKKRTRIIEAEHYRADGTLIWVSMHVSFIRDKNGNAIGLQGVTRDITKRKQTEKALEESKRKYSSYIENAPDGVFITDENGEYLEVNKAACLITGYSKEELLLIGIRDITAEESLEASMNNIRTLKEEGSSKGKLQYKHKNGSTRWWTMDAVKLNENRFLCFARDITEKQKTEEELLYLINYDYLTGIYNRRYYEKTIEELDRKSELPLSVIIGDINGLKLINDAFGHAEGDNILIQAAQILQGCCRKGDLLARIGGDEFALVLPKTNNRSAYALLKEIQAACKGHNSDISNDTFHINISLGCSTKKVMNEDFKQTFKIAEEAMYQRKLLEHKSSRSAIISSIKATMYEKSYETEEHAERMMVMSRKIGIALELSQVEIDKLELLAMLHDLGKVGIDKRILNKPGKLSIEEWVEIKKHPLIGYRIAMNSLELVPIAEYILCHHERWDGKGYPSGLCGEDIPILSRIIAIVDAYDAMTSDRAYRKSLPVKEALKEIDNNSGTQFDPRITKIFMQISNNSSD